MSYLILHNHPNWISGGSFTNASLSTTESFSRVFDICVGAGIVMSVLPAILPLGFFLGRHLYNQFLSTPKHTRVASQNDSIEIIVEPENKTTTFKEDSHQQQEQDKKLVGVVDSSQNCVQLGDSEEQIAQERKEIDSNIENAISEEETVVELAQFDESERPINAPVEDLNTVKDTTMEDLAMEREKNAQLLAKLKELNVEKIGAINDLQKEKEMTASLKNKLEKAKKLNSIKAKEILDINAKKNLAIDQLRKEKSRLQAQLEDAENLKSNQIKEIMDLSTQYKELKQTLQQIIDMHSCERLSSETQLNALENENKVFKTKQVKLLQANADLQEVADKALEEMHYFKNKYQSTKNDIDSIKKLLTESEERENKLNTKVDEMKETIMHVEDELKTKSIECDSIKENQGRLHEYIERLLKVVLENQPSLLEK